MPICVLSDFDEIKQDISSFRYEMLNHISVRQMETTDNKDRLDRLYNKIDSVLLHQKQLARAVSANAFGTDESNVLQQKEPVTASRSDSSSTNRSSSTGTSSVTEDDDDTTTVDMQKFKRAAASVKSLKQIPEERGRSESEISKGEPKLSPTKRQTSLMRQDGVTSSSVEDESTDPSIEVRDVKVHVITSPNRRYSKDEHL